jgi:hypothetical protein
MRKHVLAKIGPKGWNVILENGCISGYDRELPAEYRDAAYIVDTRTCTHENLIDFAIMGPIPNITLPHGTIHRWGSGMPSPWLIGSDRRGNAGSMDYVAPDVYAAIAAAYGATITRTEGEQP